MMNNVIHLDYAGNQFDFRSNDGWFNATIAAANFGKRPVDWLSLSSSDEYLDVLADILNCEKSSLLETRRGRYQSGTWFHPKIAVRFAQWLDARFAVWCDIQIDNLLRGKTSRHEWLHSRHEAAATFKVMTSILQMQRQSQGKTTAREHFMCEAKLVNWALAGEFKGIDRDALSAEDLDLLAKLEERNAVLIGCGMEYENRKQALKQFAASWHTKVLEAA